MNRSISFASCAGMALLVLGHAMPQAQAAPAVPRSLLITSRSIGPARIGMSVGALKRAFPGATTSSQDGPEAFFVLKKNGHEILNFATRELQRDINARLADSDTISSLRTSDPLFKTAAGIGPGSWLHNAEKLYGRPTLEFWSEGEVASFPRLPKMSFDVNAPRDPGSEYNVAGVYTRKQLEALSGTTRHFRDGTKITSVGCVR